MWTEQLDSFVLVDLYLSIQMLCSLQSHHMTFVEESEYRILVQILRENRNILSRTQNDYR
jgi:hypothetical protein